MCWALAAPVVPLLGVVSHLPPPEDAIGLLILRVTLVTYFLGAPTFAFVATWKWLSGRENQKQKN